MKKIGTDIHGLIDYLVALFLIISTTLMNISSGEAVLIVCSGVTIIVYSIGTDYFLGVFKVMPMSTHLLFDSIAGITLIVLSWLFDSGSSSSVIAFSAGTVLVLIALLTQTHPAYEFLRLHRKKLRKIFKRKNMYARYMARQHSRI